MIICASKAPTSFSRKPLKASLKSETVNNRADHPKVTKKLEQKPIKKTGMTENP